jgi:hypothetical protein
MDFLQQSWNQGAFMPSPLKTGATSEGQAAAANMKGANAGIPFPMSPLAPPRTLGGELTRTL